MTKQQTISAKEYQAMISKPETKSKYRNKPKVYRGRTYHSTREATFAAELDLKVNAGIVKDWKPQHKWKLEINGKPWTTYTIDFRVEMADGTIRYIEIKGSPTKDWLLKWEATKILFYQLTARECAELWLNEEKVIARNL